jgi:hypothetical protein
MNRNVTWGTTLFLLLGSLSISAQSTNLILRVAPPDVNGWFRVASDGYHETDDGTNLFYYVEASADLSNWVEIARLHRSPPDAVQYWNGTRLPVGTNVSYIDPGSESAGRRFYRLRALPPNTVDWRNQMVTPYDKFSSPVETVSWVKFVIATNEPTRVYFADSSTYDLHYHFVTNRIAGFSNLSREEVDRRSQYSTNRQLYFGTVLQPWTSLPWPLPEYGIQLVGRDPIPPEKVRELFDIVRSAVLSPPGMVASYLPTFEQAPFVEANRAFFETNGIPLRRIDDWIQTDTCYSYGWALGRLVFVSATNVPAAYANGTLRPTDILLTDGVPAELPYLAGIVSLAPATPNSHVAILALSYNVPFVYIADAAMRERILSYTNREVALQLTGTRYDLDQSPVGPCETLLIALDTNFDPALKAELLALKQPPPLDIRGKERFGAYTSPTTNLTPHDARFFGGKAANFGLLRRILPTNSPTPSLAISMDLWDDFMDQVRGAGTLRAEISNRLSRFTYPPNIAEVKAELATIRSIIRNQTQFTGQQQQSILAALAPFATNRNIRFRSSSNVEDADYFSGAGLYDSFSGCSGDDLSGNTGPSVCDPSEDGPRGVFRAIRRVYASFYNDNAFLERLRFNVNESEVGMGLLVHYSASDDIEMANGVATVKMAVGFEGDEANLVSQVGAVSITNPDGSSSPEEVWAHYYYYQSPPLYLGLTKSSSLRILGESVMTWRADYEDLLRMLFRVGEAYEASNSKPGVLLDFEYKKLQPGILEIKQVREVPSLVNTQEVAAYLVNERRAFASIQQSYNVRDIASTHRLKSRWTFETRNVQLTSSNLQDGFFTDVTVEWISGDRVFTNTLAGFSNLAYHVDDSSPVVPRSIYSWRMNSAVGPANFTLSAWHTYPQVSPQEDPIVHLADYGFNLYLWAEYDDPVWFLVGPIPSGNSEYVRIAPLQTNSPNEVLRILDYDQGGSGPTNVTITSRYYIGNNHLYAGEAPLFRFEETRINGLTSQPIVLRGFFSQTWYSGHRQDAEWFLFEPHLEEGIDPALLQELEAKNIRMIYVEMTNDDTTEPNSMGTFSTHAAGPLL